MTNKGLTLLEIIIALLIISIMASFALTSYERYRDRVDNAEALAVLQEIDHKIALFYTNHNRFPNNLSEVYGSVPLDPWGNPYRYLNIATANGLGQVRKDKNLVPINSDYDLYSMGKDGRSVSPLPSALSRDDIIRANNGGFYGLAEEY